MVSGQLISTFSRRLFPSTLTARTALALSLLFLIAICVLATVSLRTFRNQTTNLIVAEQNALVHRIADNLDQKLKDLQKTLTDSAGEITEHDLASRQTAQRYLNSNTGLLSAFDRSVFLFSAQGDLLAERPFRNRKGNAAWRPYFKKTIATQKPVISEPFVSNVGDSNIVLVLTAPVFAKDGQLIGVLTGSIGLTNPGLLGRIARTVIGTTGYLFIVTRDGKLIMHPQRERLSQRAFTPQENELFERALDGFQGTGETIESNGRLVLVTYRRVALSNWMVGAVYPKQEAFFVVDGLVGQFMRFLLLACLVVLAGTWGLTRYVLTPLIYLTKHIRNYSATQGRIAPLHCERGEGEIRDLMMAFNSLTTRLHERESALIKTMESYQLITENSTDLITKHTTDGNITYASPVSETMFGIPPAALVAHTLLEFVHPDNYAAVRKAFADAIQTKAVQNVIYRARHVNQQYFWCESTLRLMMNATGEETMHVLCISRDISEHKRMEKRLYDLARTDHLTNLPNRVLLDERFRDALIRTRREGLRVALLMIDLDRFKKINDTLGHDRGDALLKLMASKLTACLRESDTLVRWGGDEFVLLLPGLQNANTAIDIATRCLAVLKQPVTIDEQPLRMSASIGVTLSAAFGMELERMLREADIAMYRAKNRGGDCLAIYTSEMSAGSRRRLSLENGLFQAIERNELILHYQPLVSAKTGRLTGVEALIRWRHPELGLISPADFIPIAEESGFIVPMGEWVLRTACSQMAKWLRLGIPELTLSVNISGRQFRYDGLLHTIKTVLEETRLAPQHLGLEITETALMDDVAYTKATLLELKSLGVQAALDDFGIGYSSLNYLQGFQLDTLKIDHAFTADVLTNETNASIVRATLGLAKGLRLQTVAEGIENMGQAHFLIEQGCDILQGFLFARPMPAEDFLSFASASHTYLLSKRIS